MINICTPTLNGYQRITKLFDSCKVGTVKPDHFYIVDNGGMITNTSSDVTIHKPSRNIGCAKSVNWFLRNVPNYLFYSNDDIVVYPDTTEKLLAAYIKDPNYLLYYPNGLQGCNAWSFCLLNPTFVEMAGYLDENISPNYCYFEDNDIVYRGILNGYPTYPVADCNVIHEHSATFKNLPQHLQEEHHVKFRLARENYCKKWGGLPGEEKFKTPFGK
jgi:GT2 family glycosyltransferase